MPVDTPHDRANPVYGPRHGRHRGPAAPNGRVAVVSVLLLFGAVAQPAIAQVRPEARDQPEVRTSGGFAAETGTAPDPVPTGLPPADVPIAALAARDPATPPAAPAGFTRGIPSLVLSAYRLATGSLATAKPNCHLPAALLAAIGKVESGHARGGRVDVRGTTLEPILGPLLDGGGPVAAIADTDGGRLDGDRRWDRAVGPMQFIPGTWARWAADGNADGRPDPHNVFDASEASARYLCAANRDLGSQGGLDAAILSYNRSVHYLTTVKAWMTAYANDMSPTTVAVAPPPPASPAPVPPATTAHVRAPASTSSLPPSSTRSSASETPTPSTTKTESATTTG